MAEGGDEADGQEGVLKGGDAADGERFLSVDGYGTVPSEGQEWEGSREQPPRGQRFPARRGLDGPEDLAPIEDQSDEEEEEEEDGGDD